MIIFIADEPINNSYVASLIEAYKKQNNIVVCGVRNFYLTNLKPDILHIQWPEKILNVYPFSTYSETERFSIIEGRLRWFKENGATIVHTIHNIEPHREKKLEFVKKIFNLVISYSDILVHHCNKSVPILIDYYPEAKNKYNLVNHHPDYLIEYSYLSKNEAIKKIGLSSKDFIILNFGSQQKYKGEDFIEKVFKKLEIKNKYLLTAGIYVYDGFSGAAKLKLRIRNKIRQSINLKNRKYYYRTIKPSELSYFMNSADIILLGHMSGLNSGVLPMAATYSRPVVFPDIGCFREQMKNWISEAYEPGSQSSAVDAVTKIYRRIKNSGTDYLNNSQWLKENSWGKHVKKILEAVKNYPGIN